MEIKIRDLTKTYTSHGQPIAALRGVCLSFSHGELVAIVGRSSSGKTTLLNCLCGLEKPEGGSILLDGVDITRLSQDALAKERRRRIGVIYQSYNLIPELSVRDNITLPTELDGGEINEDALREILHTVRLLGRENDFPSALSGGQQQRVAIARALYGAPSLILADEPTGNLDEESASEIMTLLCRLQRERGITVLLVTHSAAIAARADRVITLREGCVVSDVRQ